MKLRIQLAIDFMKANLHRRLSLAELASSLELSPSHLCYLFKAQTGMSPNQYFIRLKMEMARELLATTLLSVKQIMIEVGYSSRSHFVRHFKETYGLTPSQYRAENL